MYCLLKALVSTQQFPCEFIATLAAVSLKIFIAHNQETARKISGFHNTFGFQTRVRPVQFQRIWSFTSLPNLLVFQQSYLSNEILHEPLQPPQQSHKSLTFSLPFTSCTCLHTYSTALYLPPQLKHQTKCNKNFTSFEISHEYLQHWLKMQKQKARLNFQWTTRQ